MTSDASGHGNHGKLIGGLTSVDGRIVWALHFANFNLYCVGRGREPGPETSISL